MTEEKTRREKAKNLRYKKAAIYGLTIDDINNKLIEIVEACDEVVYWMDSDNETLVDALEGDEEDADRFKLQFADLSADADRMYDDVQDIYIRETVYNDILVISGIAKEDSDDGFSYMMMGYDAYEGDYFGVSPFEYGWAESESLKRLKAMTKKDLLENVAQTIKLVFTYLGVVSRYEDLKYAMDILRAKNREHIETVKTLNEKYEELCLERKNSVLWEYSDINRGFDRLLEKLPQEAWL